jgi:hypothetical protein
MKLCYSPHFVRSYDAASTRVQKAFDKQAILLLQDFRHPSLRAKKYNETRGIWQARVTKG